MTKRRLRFLPIGAIPAHLAAAEASVSLEAVIGQIEALKVFAVQDASGAYWVSPLAIAFLRGFRPDRYQNKPKSHKPSKNLSLGKVAGFPRNELSVRASARKAKG